LFSKTCRTETHDECSSRETCRLDVYDVRLRVKVTISYLKLDVESDVAWSVVDDTLRSGALNDVQQLSLLVHVTSGRQQRHQATYQWTVLIRLERAGFRRWMCLPVSVSPADTSRHHDHQQRQTNIYQLVYLNIRFLV